MEQIDKNFKIEPMTEEGDILWWDARQEPFRIYGLLYEEGLFRRMPEEIAKKVSNGVHELHTKCSGGRVRFCTDSPFVAIRAQMHQIALSAHFSETGKSAFDLYVGEEHKKAFIPPVDMADGYESKIEFSSEGMQVITVWFPLYAGVKSLQIGLKKGCKLAPAPAYPNEKPIVFYGSSITHGACASRAGNCYTNIVSRMLGRDIWNLGFSGNAKGEQEIADYIAGLDMECFVFDYDHNAPTVEHLEQTHEPMFQKIRQAHPDIPILLMGRPLFQLNKGGHKRLDVIRKTYENAVAKGDQNVYLLSGPELMADAGFDGTVDGCHPNDWGFRSMAVAVTRVLQPLLQK